MTQLPLTMAGSRWADFYATYEPPPNFPRYRTEPRIGGTRYPVKFQPPLTPNEKNELDREYGLGEK